MKITVLSILILLLVAGLAMIQMDANTENQIQVLRETEMLTTQGLGPGPCKYVENYADMTGFCGDILCDYSGMDDTNTHYYYRQTAIAYDRCSVDNPYNTTDCVLRKDQDGNQMMQPCAEMTFYSASFQVGCDPLYQTGSYKVMTEDVSNVPGCSSGGGGGGWSGGGTSS